MNEADPSPGPTLGTPILCGCHSQTCHRFVEVDVTGAMITLTMGSAGPAIRLRYDVLLSQHDAQALALVLMEALADVRATDPQP